MCFPLRPYKIEREWTHAGLLCVVVQAREAQNRCGYVRVPPNHPDFAKDYNDVDVNVHGGLTFGQIEPCSHEDGQGYWFGFDCAHFDDAIYDPNVDLAKVSPKVRRLLEIHTDMNRKYSIECHFWTEEEVVNETNKLAEQLAQRSR